MKMKKTFKPGAKVKWNWMGRTVNGTVEKMYVTRVSKSFRGTVFTRLGSVQKPAYLVKSAAGNLVLKSQTELI